ncbi:hypothetical protein J2X76_003629 [Neorhizobium sp. 2083]|uniref:hypothetical protein n=1 Tax=Neorhizobium sp. 2083 TaxID=2817762 RepID=UPI00285A5EF0|nr:hypothetical protein [Neorhizobium sp. 2083]MDR6818452.1 hypothetical protein [Neorhizobium sp. 2083]
MADRPILFSAPMVIALLAGTKTQTRRILKPQPTINSAGLLVWESRRDFVQGLPRDVAFMQRIAKGDRLWVKENHAIVPRTAYRMSEGVQQILRPDDDHDAAVYAAGWDRSKPGRWRPSIHMPRWASRLTLTVTDVRVEWLQDISGSDAIAEGADITREMTMTGPMVKVAPGTYLSPIAWYHRLWDEINGEGSWDANPWVVAYTFTVERGNIDQIGRAAA